VTDIQQRFTAGLFQALAHVTRVAMVELLRHGEMSVGQLCQRLGVRQANASQHLAVLRNKNIVHARKAGNQTFYGLRDPAFAKVLDLLGEYVLAQLTGTLEVLQREQAKDSWSAERPARKPKR